MSSSIDAHELPAATPPPGVASDFNSPDNYHGSIMAISITCTVCSAVTVMLRLYTRLSLTKSHGWVDYILIAAWLGLLGFAILGWINNGNGPGYHQWDVRLDSLTEWAKLANIMEIYYSPLIFLTKISILMQYLNVFVPKRLGRNKTYWTIHALIWVNLLFYVASLIAFVLLCVPREKIWNPMVPGQCINIYAAIVSASIVNVISDLSMLVLPIIQVLQLHLSKNRKIAIIAVFAFGLFACIGSVMRTYYSIQFILFADATYYLTAVYLCSIAEVSLGIICGCLPALPALFRHLPETLSRYGPQGRDSAQVNSHAGRPTNSDQKRWDKEGQYCELSDKRPLAQAQIDRFIHRTDEFSVLSEERKTGPPTTDSEANQWAT